MPTHRVDTILHRLGGVYLQAGQYVLITAVNHINGLAVGLVHSTDTACLFEVVLTSCEYLKDEDRLLEK